MIGLFRKVLEFEISHSLFKVSDSIDCIKCFELRGRYFIIYLYQVSRGEAFFCDFHYSWIIEKLISRVNIYLDHIPKISEMVVLDDRIYIDRSPTLTILLKHHACIPLSHIFLYSPILSYTLSTRKRSRGTIVYIHDTLSVILSWGVWYIPWVWIFYIPLKREKILSCTPISSISISKK